MPLAEPWIRTADDVVAEMRSDATEGLDGPEAERRLVEHGPNELVAEPPVPL